MSQPDSTDDVNERAMRLVSESADTLEQLLDSPSLTVLAADMIRELVASMREGVETVAAGSRPTQTRLTLWRQAIQHARNGWGVVEAVKQLPVYLLLDTSGSMRGEPIESVKVGLQSMIAMLRNDPRATESVHISIIRFDRDVETLTELTPLSSFQQPALLTPDSGPTHMGMALEELCRRIDVELMADDEDWADPLLLLMTDGSPSDKMKYREMVERIKARKFGRIIACAAGAKAKTADLKTLADVVVSLDTMDASSFSRLFEWFFQGIHDLASRSVSTLPPPPAEVHIVL